MRDIGEKTKDKRDVEQIRVIKAVRHPVKLKLQSTSSKVQQEK